MTRYQHRRLCLPSGLSRGCIVTGRNCVGAQLKSGARRQHQHRAAGVQTLETMKLITPQPRSGYFVDNVKPSRQCHQ